jgi:choline transport protein
MMASMVFSILAWLAVLIVLPVKTPSHTSASFIFTSTENISGWPSFGMAFMIGLLNANWSFGLLDAVSHLAEEIVRPEVNVPRALFASIAIGFATAWPLAIVLVYCMFDFDAVTSAHVPLLELFHLVFSGNRGAAVGLLSLILITLWFSTVGLHTYQMRICWAFSRDNGLPFSTFWSRVPKQFGVPINAHLLCLVLVNIISLLCIASTTAFNR